MNTDRSKKLVRLTKAAALGLLCGLLLLSLFALPLAISQNAEQAAAAIKQQNLTPARGEAFGFGTTPSVTVTALYGGKEHSGIAISPDMRSWYTPQNAQVCLSLVPGTYDFCAALDNRLVRATHEVTDGQNTVILDINKAPAAPDLLMFEVQKGESKIIPLDIADADEVSCERIPDGVKIVRADGVFALSVDGALTDYGFYPIRLIAKNGRGEATVFASIRIPKQQEVTKIYTVEDLKNIRRNLSGSYLLMNDLDMRLVDDYMPPGSVSYPFTGVFDGGGHEIINLHAPDTIAEEGGFSLLGWATHAEIRNVIVRGIQITPQVPVREGKIAFFSAAIANSVTFTLIENCASIGGVVDPSDGYTAGCFNHVEGTIVKGVFNSTRVFGRMVNRFLPNTGGVFSGSDQNYVAYCANEGEIKGNHLTGGIAGFSISDIKKCINSGTIWGSTLVGEFPPGGIVQTMDFGSTSYCYFVRGTSATGGNSFYNSVVNSLLPIQNEELRDAQRLSLLGDFEGDSPDWAYASLDANGPVPFGVFMQQTDTPQIQKSGNGIIIPARDGLRYFYTLDGSSPYTGSVQEADSIEVTLSKGQLLTVFAARQGFRDSEIIHYSLEGGE